MAQRAFQFVHQFLPVACVGTVEFDIDDRLGRAFTDPLQHAGRIACRRDDRVKQAVHRQAVTRDHAGNAVHQERHVVIDQRPAHAPIAGFAAHRLQADDSGASRAIICGFAHEGGGLGLFALSEAGGFTRQGSAGQQVVECRLQALVSARTCRHLINRLAYVIWVELL